MNKIILLNGKLLHEKKHAYIQDMFSFPSYYGNNSDALYDCLTDLDHVEVVIYNQQYLTTEDDPLIQVFHQAEKDSSVILYI